MNESNKVFKELVELTKRVEKLASPEQSGTVLWGEVKHHLENAINLIKKDKRIYGW